MMMMAVMPMMPVVVVVVVGVAKDGFANDGSANYGSANDGSSDGEAEKRGICCNTEAIVLDNDCRSRPLLLDHDRRRGHNSRRLHHGHGWRRRHRHGNDLPCAHPGRAYEGDAMTIWGDHLQLLAGKCAWWQLDLEG